MNDRSNNRSKTYDEAAVLNPGDRHYRSFIGTPSLFDLEAGMQFQIMLALGLREFHRMLDIGCGSLRGGRLFLSYLRPGRYYGIEPNGWLIDDAIENELGREFIDLRNPQFSGSSNFELSDFGVSFDYVLAQSILTHTGRAQLEACLKAVSNVLLPDGIFAASFNSTGSDHKGNEWVYPEFVSYTPDFIMDLAMKCGLQAYPLIWPAHHGQYWMVFLPMSSERDVSWLSLGGGKPSVVRFVQLQRQLLDERVAHARTRERLKSENSGRQG